MFLLQCSKKSVDSPAQVCQMPDTNGLTAEHLANLDLLIDAVRSNPEYLKTTLSEGVPKFIETAVTANLVTCCILLVAHVVPAVATTATADGGTTPDPELVRRIQFTRNASLQQLLDIREQAAGVLGR